MWILTLTPILTGLVNISLILILIIVTLEVSTFLIPKRLTPLVNPHHAGFCFLDADSVLLATLPSWLFSSCEKTSLSKFNGAATYNGENKKNSTTTGWDKAYKSAEITHFYSLSALVSKIILTAIKSYL